MQPSAAVHGNVADHGSTQINNVHLAYSTTSDIDRLCLHELRLPEDPFVVKNRLRSRDKLLPQLKNWIRDDAAYTDWHDGQDVNLLHIRGGAGKGKTMLSIGLIEELLRERDEHTAVTYVFCQNADESLNTAEAMLKGLILQMTEEDETTKGCIRKRWDVSKNCFGHNVVSFQGLWDLFTEMLDQCRRRRIYVVMDALEECQRDGLGKLLRAIDRNGLGNHRVKWLLTSRPFDQVDHNIPAGLEKKLVSLDLNLGHVANAVKAYVNARVDELDRQEDYGHTLCADMKEQLTRKAQGTFLWVNIVCKSLEGVSADQVMAKVKESPEGLDSLYGRVLRDLGKGRPKDVQQSMLLLQVVLLAYRPMQTCEVKSVIGDEYDEARLRVLADRCASFMRWQDGKIEFIHESARDYLRSLKGQADLGKHTGTAYRHAEAATSCMSSLICVLKPNLLALARWDATKAVAKRVNGKHSRKELESIHYAAAFWAQHLTAAIEARNDYASKHLTAQAETFMQTRLLEWLEYLSLLDSLPQAVLGLQELSRVAKIHSLQALLQDASRVLSRHYQTISIWPLQVYSSAIVFSPQKSLVRMQNAERKPKWLKQVFGVEEEWDTLLQTLTGHSEVYAIAISSNGQHIVSGSEDMTVKVWAAATGECERTLRGHSSVVSAVAFSPDGQRIVSGSWDKTVKVWSAATGECEQTLRDHWSWVIAVAFSPDGQRIVTGSDNETVKVWSTATGECERTLRGHSSVVSAVAFSRDGQHIVSGSEDWEVKVWSTATGECEQTLADQATTEGGIRAFADLLGRAGLASDTPDEMTADAQTPGQQPLTEPRLQGPESRAVKRHDQVIREEERALGQQSLSIREQWVYHGNQGILTLPAELPVSCFDVQARRVVVGCGNGRVVVIEIDGTAVGSRYDLIEGDGKGTD